MIEFKHKLLDDRVVLLPDPKEEKTSSGLYFGKSAQKLSDKATVVAIGMGTIATDTGVLIPMFVSVGDRVVFDKFKCEEFEGFEGLLLTRQSSIKCILDES